MRSKRARARRKERRAQERAAAAGEGTSEPIRSSDVQDVARRLCFGSIVTDKQVESVIRRGFELAEKSQTGREYGSAMRPIVQLMQYQAELEGANKPQPTNVHNHLHIETTEQKQQRLLAVSAELGLDGVSEAGEQE